MSHDPDGRDANTVVTTAALVEALLDVAARAEPTKVTVDLSVTAGSAFASDEIPDDVSVFSHYYLPNVATSTSDVFGMNMTVPPGQTQGRFVSHPRSKAELTVRDSLHEVVFLAVPPWTRDDLRVFDRAGRRQPLRIVDAEPPVEELP